MNTKRKTQKYINYCIVKTEILVEMILPYMAAKYNTIYKFNICFNFQAKLNSAACQLLSQPDKLLAIVPQNKLLNTLKCSWQSPSKITQIECDFSNFCLAFHYKRISQIKNVWNSFLILILSSFPSNKRNGNKNENKLKNHITISAINSGLSKKACGGWQAHLSILLLLYIFLCSSYFRALDFVAS